MRQQGVGIGQAARAGDLVLTGGATGGLVRAQLTGLLAAIAQQGLAPEVLALLRGGRGAGVGPRGVPAVLAGFDDLSYPQMRVEIGAIVTLARPA